MKKKKKRSFWRKTPKEEICQRRRFRFLSKRGILENPIEIEGINYIVMTKRKEKKLRIKLLRGIEIIGKNKIENLDFVDYENYSQEKERIIKWFIRAIPYDNRYYDNYYKTVSDFIAFVIEFAIPPEY